MSRCYSKICDIYIYLKNLFMRASVVWLGTAIIPPWVPGGKTYYSIVIRCSTFDIIHAGLPGDIRASSTCFPIYSVEKVGRSASTVLVERNGNVHREGSCATSCSIQVPPFQTTAWVYWTMAFTAIIAFHGMGTTILTP